MVAISFKELLPEDGRSRWPKNVAGYAVYNTVNLHVCICTGWLFLVRNHQCMVMYHWKFASPVHGHVSLKVRI